MLLKRSVGLATAAGLVIGLVGATVAPASAGTRHDDTPGHHHSARGLTSITANDSVTGTLLEAGLAVFTLEPATSSLTDEGTRLTMRIPVSGKGKSGIRHSGGFTIVNLRDGGQVTCERPTIRLKDSTVTCYVPELDARAAVFAITSTESVTMKGRWVKVSGAQLAIVNDEMADTLNTALNTTVFATGADLFTADVMARTSWRGHHPHHGNS